MTAPPAKPFITVAPGPRNAHTDPESGLRFYRWQTRDLPSATSARRMAGLPFGLHNWTINQVIDAAIDRRLEILSRLALKPEDEQVIRHELRKAATAERDRAAALGTAVHDAVATGIDPALLPIELVPRVFHFKNWLETSHAKLLGSEFQVFNLTEGYAGTCDALVRFPDGSIWIVDYKTGKNVYADHALQIVAYAQAEFVGEDDVVNEELTDLLGKVTGMALLRLSDDGWAFYRVRWDEALWQAFLGLLRFATWSYEHQTPDTFVQASRKGKA